MGYFPRFGMRKSAGYTLQQLIDLVAQPSNPAYMAWAARPGGAAAAEQLCRDFYDRHHSAQHKAEGIADIVNIRLRQDNIKYGVNTQTLARFAGRAANGHFSQGLSRRGNHTKGLYYTPGERKSEYERAADWVIKSSATLHGQGSGGKAWKDLIHAMEVVVETDGITSSDALRFLHGSAGHIAQQSRIGSEPNLFYGTTALGQHLLPQVFNFARPMQTAAFLQGRQKAATDLAVYLMIGVILAHPFGDGNGRSARALYACTQIKYGNRFVPADYQWVLNQTHETNMHAVVNAGVPDYVRAGVHNQPRRHMGRARGHNFETVDIAAERAREAAERERFGDLIVQL